MLGVLLSRRGVLRVVAAVALSAVLTGCGSKVSKDNFDKVKDGMTLSEVEGLLGKGKEQSSASVPGASAGGVTIPGASAKGMVWQDGNKMISVTFVNDKVMGKAQTGL